MKRWESKRLAELGSAIFSEVAAWKREVTARGVDVIDLGIGSPDHPPSARVMDALTRAVNDPGLYGYPTSEGSLQGDDVHLGADPGRLDVSTDFPGNAVFRGSRRYSGRRVRQRRRRLRPHRSCSGRGSAAGSGPPDRTVFAGGFPLTNACALVAAYF